MPFDRELSVLAVRGRDGATARLARGRERAPRAASCASRARRPRDRACRRAEEAARRGRSTQLDYVGVLALELFDAGGAVLANEIAPRVHNSGHWTIEGADTSQFENHVRAVLGLPLGSTGARGARRRWST